MSGNWTDVSKCIVIRRMYFIVAVMIDRLVAEILKHCMTLHTYVHTHQAARTI